MSWNWVDVLVIFLLVRWAYVGHQTRFAVELAKLCTIFVTYYFAIRYYDDLAVWVMDHTRLSIDWSIVVAFTCISLFLLFIVRYALKLIGRFATLQFAAAVGTLGGFFTGAVRGVVVSALLLYGLFLIPNTYVKRQIYKDSWWGKKSIDATPVYYKKITAFFYQGDTSSEAVTRKYREEKARLTKKQQRSRVTSLKKSSKTQKHEKLSTGQRVSESFQDWLGSLKDKFEGSETQEGDREVTEETERQFEDEVDQAVEQVAPAPEGQGIDQGMEASPASGLLKVDPWE